MTQQPSYTAKDALTGAGIGSIAGLLSTLFKKDRTLKDFVKRTLIGGGAGAAAGVGLGSLTRGKTSAPPPTSVKDKPRLDPNAATVAGLLPGIGSAIYGATESADGDRAANSIKLGLASLAGGIPGGHLARMAAQSSNQRSVLLSALAAMGGSAALSRVAADQINKSASTLGERFQQGLGSLKESLNGTTARFQQGFGSLKDSFNDATVRPYNPMSSAAFGAIPGAVLGGGVGLLRSALDGEDDGVMSTLGKILSGAGVGGLGGAAIYGGMSALRRNDLLSGISNPTRRDQAARALAQFELPLNKSRNIAGVNALAGADQIASPALVRLLRSNNKQPNERR